MRECGCTVSNEKAQRELVLVLELVGSWYETRARVRAQGERSQHAEDDEERGREEHRECAHRHGCETAVAMHKTSREAAGLMQ